MFITEEGIIIKECRGEGKEVMAKDEGVEEEEDEKEVKGGGESCRYVCDGQPCVTAEGKGRLPRCSLDRGHILRATCIDSLTPSLVFRADPGRMV